MTERDDGYAPTLPAIGAPSIQPGVARQREHGNHTPIIGPNVLMGLGLGGFFDGIVLHQILQWHHLTSATYPPTTLDTLKLNTLADGLFHAATWIFTVVGIVWVWWLQQTPARWWTGRSLGGGLLLGWGLFNLIEGLINHQLLGIHHVNETVARDQWILWDGGFLIWGAVMMLLGWGLTRAHPRKGTIGR